MVRRASALASAVLLAAGAASACGQVPYDGSFQTGGAGTSHGGSTGDAGGTTTAPAGADAAAADDGSASADAGVSLGDAAMPTNCTIGPAGAVAFVPLETMAPGMDCGACHLAIGKPVYIAGTVEPTYHEPDLCLGVAGLQIEIVDHAGAAHTLPVDSSGNFVDQNPLALWPAPWKVAVLSGSSRREMISTVTDGDCNSCHTAAGASNEPGRILPPDSSDGG